MKLSPARWRSFSMYLTVFTGGLVSLALELSASRFLAPVFGTTDLIWSAIIGLILLYLSIGYLLGGRLADKHPHADLLYTLLGFAAVSIAVIPILGQPVLNLAIQGMHAWDLAWIAGPFIAVLLLFIVPVTLLAFITPFAARLNLTGTQDSGKITGKLYAISTVGSFIGTLLPNYLLIPWIGTRRTFLLLALLIEMCALLGLWLSRRKRFWAFLPVFIGIIVLLSLPVPSIKPIAGLIHEQESRYNFIQVVERSGTRYLLLNEGQGIHSMFTPFEAGTEDMALLTAGPWDYYLIAPWFQKSNQPVTVNNLCVIGLAAGTSVTQFSDVYGPIPIDGVEIDAAIADVGAEYFALKHANLQVHATDGRTFLQGTETTYSLIAIDAYRLPYIPWHLTTQEFFTQVYTHLDQNGVTAINVGHTTNDFRLVDAMATTMSQVFPSVYVINVPESFNMIVIATKQATTLDDFAVNVVGISDARLRFLANAITENLHDYEESTLVFTDDRAPVEFLTNATALSYILNDE